MCIQTILSEFIQDTRILKALSLEDVRDMQNKMLSGELDMQVSEDQSELGPYSCDLPCKWMRQWETSRNCSNCFVYLILLKVYSKAIKQAS